MNDIELITPRHALLETAGELAIKREQYLPDSFYEDLKFAKDASVNPAGEMNQVMSIPTAVVDHWINQGFDFWNAPAKEIAEKLRSEHLDAFITTTKRF